MLVSQIANDEGWQEDRTVDDSSCGTKNKGVSWQKEMWRQGETHYPHLAVTTNLESAHR
jgi:hypothetical protein